MGKPTNSEKITQNLFDVMDTITVSALKKFSRARKVPSPTYSSYLIALEEKDWSYAVKPLYSYTISTNKKGVPYIDYEKPQRAYKKLFSSGR